MALSTKTKIMYASGDFTGTFASTIVGIFYLYFLTTTMQIPPAIAGGIILVGNAWDAISDPLVGAWSDRLRTKHGRRRPFLLWSALPLMIVFALLWTVPQTFGLTGRIIYTLITYLFYITMMTLVMVPYGALCNDITEDYDERSLLQGYRMVVSIGGGLIAAIMPELLVTAVADVWVGHALMGVVFALLIGIAPLFPYFGTYERKVPYVHPTPLWDSVKKALQVTPFRIIILIYLLVWAAVGLVQAMLKYYLDYWLGRPSLYLVLAAIIFIVAALVIPLWVKLSQKLDKTIAFRYGMGLFGVALLTLVFIPATTTDMMLYLLSFLLSIGVSAAHVIPVSMIPDAVEYGTRQIQSSSEGVFYGMVTFVQKIGVALAIGGAGLLLEVAGFSSIDPSLNLTNDAVQWTVRLLIGGIPGIMMLASLWIIRHYPISRTTYHEWMSEPLDQ